MKINYRKGSWAIIPVLIISFVSTFVSSSANATSVSIPDAGFEDNTFTGWSRGSQTGTLGASINGGGTGVTIFNGSRTFTHGPNGAMGNPTLSDGSPNPYYAPAVAAGSWTFSPKGGTYAVALQPKSEQTFDQATNALGLSATENSAIKAMLAQQAAAAGFGNGNPTDAAWITREVELTAGVIYTMSWNYMATDYVPYNDGSITSLVPVTVESTPVITVNNFEQSYALLGFTNPGTGDYSTNSYGSTGWQTSTYEVSVSGTYNLGFTVFNLDDTALSPVLMVDDEIGTTQICIQGGSCETFGGVEPNNETAPTVAPTTTTTVPETTSTTTTTTTTTVPDVDICPPENLTISETEASILLDWDAPSCGTNQPERYAIGFTTGDIAGWGVATGNVGGPSALNTYYAFSKLYFANAFFNIESGSTWRFRVRSDNDTSSFYSTFTEEVSIVINYPVATTTTTTTTAVPNTTTTTVVINIPEAPTTQPEVINLPETLPEPPVEVFPQPTPDVNPDLDQIIEETPSEIIDSILEEIEVDTSLPDIEAIEPEIVDPLIEDFEIIIPDEPLTEEQVDQVIDEIINASIEDVVDLLETLSVEQLDQVFEEVSVEQLTEILDSLSQEEVLGIIENIESVDALENVIDAISEETIDPDTAIAVIENGNFEELPLEEVAAVFAAIEPDQFTEEQKTELATALTDAPTEIKELFEEEVDIYGDGFDDYVPTGSSIDVGTRKSILAATAAVAAIAVGSASTGGSTGGSSGGGSGGSGGSGSSGGTEGRSRKEEESGEMAGEIAGPEEDDGEDFAKNSIYKYYTREGKEMKKFNWFGFSKKMWDITAGLAFTLAGSLVVYITLSGITQRVAGIATLTAILVHYVHEILKNDE